MLAPNISHFPAKYLIREKNYHVLSTVCVPDTVPNASYAFNLRDNPIQGYSLRFTDKLC